MNDQSSDNFQPAAPQPSGNNTASYTKRFLAFAIDMFLLVLTMMFMMRFLGFEPSNTADMQAAQAELVAKLSSLNNSQKIMLTLTPYVSFFLLHGFLLHQYGQTIGKRMLGIAIVTLANQKPAFFTLIIQRYFSQWVMGLVPAVGMLLRLIDIAMILQKDKRCLHDIIAGTKVIDLKIAVSSNPNSLIA